MTRFSHDTAPVASVAKHRRFMAALVAGVAILGCQYANPASAAIGTSVQIGGNGGSAGTTLATTLTGAGQGLVVIAMGVNNASGFSTVADTALCSWTIGTNSPGSASNSASQLAWSFCSPAIGDVITITNTTSGSAKSMLVYTVSGVSSFDAQGVAQTSGSQSSLSVSSGTLASNNDIAFVSLFNNGASTAPAATGFTFSASAGSTDWLAYSSSPPVGSIGGTITASLSWTTARISSAAIAVFSASGLITSNGHRLTLLGAGQ